jgi:hypothetical protein
MGRPEDCDVQIKDLAVNIEITEGVGPLSAADLKQIVKLVLEQIRAEQYRSELNSRQRRITDRVSNI